jgi:hypothetical protein
MVVNSFPFLLNGKTPPLIPPPGSEAFRFAGYYLDCTVKSPHPLCMLPFERPAHRYTLIKKTNSFRGKIDSWLAYEYGVLRLEGIRSKHFATGLILLFGLSMWLQVDFQHYHAVGLFEVVLRRFEIWFGL